MQQKTGHKQTGTNIIYVTDNNSHYSNAIALIHSQC